MSITAEQFAAQRHPVRGRSNPEPMDKPVWTWLVETGLNAYKAAAMFGAPPAHAVGPGWCFERFGCSRTQLPDGRILRIAGEHEDYYDPDFYIYNDVIVRHPDGRIEIFGYPEDVFPPTDFHSATLVEEQVWIIGNVGYPQQRRPGTTPVHSLSLDTLAIDSVSTTGEPPGWIHRHTATFCPEAGGIVVRRGIVELADGAGLRDNIDDWLLELPSLRWRRLTHRPFQQWHVRRKDAEPLMLFEMESLAFELEYASGGAVDPGQRLGPRREHFDLALFGQLFRPPVEGEVEDPSARSRDDFERDDDNTYYDQSRLRMGETLVRYADDRNAIAVKIEGPLSESDTQVILDDLIEKLGRLQGCSCEAIRLG